MLAPLIGKQRESVRLSTARGNLWEGAVRSSKTISSIFRWLRYVREGPAGPLLMVGKTERTLKRNIIDPIIEMVGARRCNYKAGAGEVELLGRKIYLAGANDERAAEKIKGLTLAGAYCDELTTFPKSFFAMLLTRLSVEGAQWFGTTNPEAKTHWLMKDYLSRARLHLTRDGRVLVSEDPEALDIHRFSFQLTDNPNLPAEYVEDLKRENVGLFYRRYILGEWVLAEGAVYDMFDEDRHVIDVLPAIDRWFSVGVDYGTVNPFSALAIGLGTDRRLHVVSEYRYDSRKARRQLTDGEYSERMRSWLASVPRPGEQGRATGIAPERIYVDPSAASFMTQLWRDQFVGVVEANNSVLDGIRTVSTLLGADQLRIHRSCTGLLDELPGYSWDDAAAEKGEDKPLKIDDHSADALRYGLHSSAWLWRPLIRNAVRLAA
ncbi:PBSX family phage terminase large subunit [Nonomuraea sp. NPDC003560]|uniref:PBSX family phage terminase large subunit n=1 Tax=Nonomuraea sp. NPDC003560 TaxID=3364341 RepID=UPI0036B813BC